MQTVNQRDWFVLECQCSVQGARGSCWAARHRSCKGMGKRACAWEMLCSSRGEGETKGCTWTGSRRAASGLGNFTKAMKCGMNLAHTLPATISDVQDSFLRAFNFFVVNNSLAQRNTAIYILLFFLLLQLHWHSSFPSSPVNCCGLSGAGAFFGIVDKNKP